MVEGDWLGAGKTNSAQSQTPDIHPPNPAPSFPITQRTQLLFFESIYFRIPSYTSTRACVLPRVLAYFPHVPQPSTGVRVCRKASSIPSIDSRFILPGCYMACSFTIMSMRRPPHPPPTPHTCQLPSLPSDEN